MKKLLFISILFVFALNVNAQMGAIRDTISTSASVDTAIAYPSTTVRTKILSQSRHWEQNSSLDIIGTVTRISGTTNAILYLQVANKAIPLAWSNVDSVAISGTDPIPFHFELATFDNYLFRLYGIAPSSTQVCHWVADWKVTRKL